MTPKSSKTNGTKALTGAVLIIGVSALFYGGYSIAQQVITPFTAPVPTGIDLSELAPKTEEEELEALKLADSDQDTLSDYDEIHIYNTSPYIRDTDSDGFSDAQEIAEGSDPTCPPGGDCFGIRLVTPETKISDLFPQFSDSTISLKEKTLTEFRQIILDQGFDEEKLKEVSDEELLVILEETLKFQDEESSNETTGISDVDLNEVRLFLIELGVPEDEVYSLSNVEVEQILATFE